MKQNMFGKIVLPQSLGTRAARRLGPALLALLVIVGAASFFLSWQPWPSRDLIGLDVQLEDTVLERPALNFVAAQTVSRPYLGITYVTLNAHVARQYGLAVEWGVLVTAVAKESPADRAGIRIADVLHTFDDQPLTGDVSLLDLLWDKQPGNPVSILGLRDGQHYATRVVLGVR